MGGVEERELWSQRRAREIAAHRGIHKESISPSPLA